MTLAKLIEALRRETPANGRHGNRIYRLFRPADRYLVDFDDHAGDEGWEQFDTDQDAHYFGVWVNPKLLLTLTYAEGDWALVECADTAHYNAEIQSAIDFYGEGFVAKTMDAAGNWTTYCQNRSVFLVAEGVQ
jgi:hypothetical protein